MGLLDGNLDPQSMATMQLAAGLLSPGSFGQGLGKGLAGYQGTLANSQEMQIKQQQLEMAKLQFAAQMRNQTLINNAIEQGMGDQSAPQQQPGQPSVMAGMGQQPPSISSPGNPTMGGQAPQQGGPRMMMGAPAAQTLPDLMFNGGKGIGKMVQDYRTPISMRPNAFGVSPDGRTTHYPTASPGNTIVSDGNGGWMEKPIPGGLGAVAASSEAAAGGKNAFNLRTFLSPTGEEMSDYNRNLSSYKAGAGAPDAADSHGTSQVSTGGSGAINPTTTTGNTSGRPQTGAKSSIASTFKSSQATDGNGSVADVSGGPLLAQSRSTQNAVLADIKKTGAPTATVNGLPLEAASAPTGMPSTAMRTGFAPGVKASADQNADNNANEVSKKWSVQLEAHQQAQTTNSYLDSIAQLAKNAKTGPFSDRIAFMNALLSPFVTSADASLSDKQLLDKYQNQITSRLGSGGSATDASRSIITAAYPNSKMVPSAIMEAVDNLRGANNMTQARTKLLQPIAASRDANTNSAYDAAATNFDSNADPRLFQLKNMNPLQAQKYLSQMPDNVKADLIKRAQALKAAGAL